MEDPAHSQRVLERLHELGVVLSIDDYGTGYSSLSYVARLPVDELKIDRSFIKQMSDSTTATIVRSTIELGHSLGLKVVAEGVEDEADSAHPARLWMRSGAGLFHEPAAAGQGPGRVAEVLALVATGEARERSPQRRLRKITVLKPAGLRGA